jgi:hypothetical protein
MTIGRDMLSRRRLIAALAGATSLNGRASLAACSGYLTPRISASDTLVDLCSGLRCLGPIGDACLRALPESETSPAHLVSLILADVPSAGRDFGSVLELRQSLRKQSQADFSGDKIVNVEGWMLSLTETRIYAMAALLGSDRSHPVGYSVLPLETHVVAPRGARANDTAKIDPISPSRIDPVGLNRRYSGITGRR